MSSNVTLPRVLYCGPGKAFILVNFRGTRKVLGKDIPKGVNRAFAVTIEQFKAARELLLSQGKKSLNYGWFVEYATELSRVKFDGKYGWDLSPLARGNRTQDGTSQNQF